MAEVKKNRYAPVGDEEVGAPVQETDDRPTSLVLEGGALESSATVDPSAGEGDPAARLSALDRKFSDVGDEEVTPLATVGEKLTAVAQGGIAGLVQSTTTVPAVLAGAELGMRAGAPLGGVGRAVGGVAGGVVGFGASLFAGSQAIGALENLTWPDGTPITVDSPEKIPLHLRPYYAMGQDFSGSIPYAALPFLVPALAAGNSQVAAAFQNSFYNRAIKAAKDSPATFLLAEASMAVSAAGAGGAAEQYFPGNIYARLAGNVGGAVGNPVGWVVTGVRAALSHTPDSLRSAMVSFRENPAAFFDGSFKSDQTGALARAAEQFFARIEKAGGDPRALPGIIREAAKEFPDLKLTAGQLTGNEYLLAIEARLARDSAKFGAESEQMAKDSLKVLAGTIRALEDTGNPQALKMAAQMQSDMFHTVVGGEIQRLQQKMVDLAADLKPQDAISRAQYSVAATQVIDDSVSVLRGAENEAWTAAAKQFPVPVDFAKVLGHAQKVRAERLPTEELPPVLERFFVWLEASKAGATKAFAEKDMDELIRLVFREEGKTTEAAAKTYLSGERPVDVGLLVLFRSRMLAMARNAAKSTESVGPDNARVFGGFAEAALDDLIASGAATKTVSGVRTGADGLPAPATAYDKARELSFMIADKLNRTVAADARAVDASGANRIPPEVFLHTAWRGGRELGDVNFRALSDLAERAGAEQLSRMTGAQRGYVFHLASETVDKITGLINPRKLAEFKAKNADVLEHLQLTSYFENVAKAEKLIGKASGVMETLQATARRSEAFSKVLAAGESPEVAVSKAISSLSPQAELKALAQLAHKHGPDAVEGLRTAVYNHIYNQAQEGGALSFSKYWAAFNKPLFLKGPTLGEVLGNLKIVTPDETQAIARINRRAASIEVAAASRRPEDLAQAPEDALNDFFLRLAGARAIGETGLTQGMGPGSIVVSAAGPKLFKQLFDQIPAVARKQASIELSKNPLLLADLLEAYQKSPKEQKKLLLQTYAVLMNAGAIFLPGAVAQGVNAAIGP